MSHAPDEKSFTFDNLKPIKFKPRNDKQILALETIEKNKITFLKGAVGSGKTVLAVYYALEALRKREISKIVILRPATVKSVEAIGFLSGDMQEKIAPLVRSVIQPMEEFTSKEHVAAMVEDGVIEPYALAYTQGLTYKNAVVIFDEFQNTTFDLLTMVMTRIDDRSKLIILGDENQITLDDPSISCVHDIGCFKRARKDIRIVEFVEEDIERAEITKIVYSCIHNNHLDEKGEKRVYVTRDR